MKKFSQNRFINTKMLWFLKFLSNTPRMQWNEEWKNGVVGSVRSELSLSPQQRYSLFILLKLFPQFSNIWKGIIKKNHTLNLQSPLQLLDQTVRTQCRPQRQQRMDTYVLSVYFCAARCRSSWAPSSSSSSAPSVESSGWPPRCGGGPWCPLALLWLLPSPLHPLVAAQPPFSASLFPETNKKQLHLTPQGLQMGKWPWGTNSWILTSSFRLS